MHVVSPGVVDGHARLPQLKVFGLGNDRLQLLLNARVDGVKPNALCGDPAGDKLFRCLVISGNADSIIHECGRLQVPNQFNKSKATVFFLMMQTIEPDKRCRTVLRQQLG